MENAEQPMVALILAGRRPGGAEPLETGDVKHKAFIRFENDTMIERVIRAVEAASGAREIWVSAPEDIRDALRALPGFGENIQFVEAAGSPSRTIEAAIAAAPDGAELFVTTCDHPLLTGQMVSTFLGTINKDQCGVAAACVSRPVYEAEFPNTRRTFIRFKDFEFSGANLFWFKKDKAGPLISFWRRLEANRKNPAKMAMEIGLLTGALYATGQLKKKRALARLEQIAQTGVMLVDLPFAEAAVDVDKPADIDVVASILSKRASF